MTRRSLTANVPRPTTMQRSAMAHVDTVRIALRGGPGECHFYCPPPLVFRIGSERHLDGAPVDGRSWSHHHRGTGD